MKAAVIAAFFLAACTSTPSRAPSPAPLAPAAATAAPTPQPAFDPRRAQVNRMAAELGYHVEVRDQQRFFCRTAAPLGTRLTQKECMSEDTMTDAVRSMEQNRNSWQQPKVCQGAQCEVK
jgi:hypothetical protein